MNTSLLLSNCKLAAVDEEHSILRALLFELKIRYIKFFAATYHPYWCDRTTHHFTDECVELTSFLKEEVFKKKIKKP